MSLLKYSGVSLSSMVQGLPARAPREDAAVYLFRSSGNGRWFPVRAVLEGSRSDVLRRGGQLKGRQRLAIQECVGINRVDGSVEGDGGQVLAAIECFTAYLCHVAMNRDFCQRLVVFCEVGRNNGRAACHLNLLGSGNNFVVWVTAVHVASLIVIVQVGNTQLVVAVIVCPKLVVEVQRRVAVLDGEGLQAGAPREDAAVHLFCSSGNGDGFQCRAVLEGSRSDIFRRGGQING